LRGLALGERRCLKIGIDFADITQITKSKGGKWPEGKIQNLNKARNIIEHSLSHKTS
jgi:hypothetical protein